VVALLQDWATVLASPRVMRIAEACSAAEDAAWTAALAGKGVEYVDRAVAVCLQGMQGSQPAGAQVIALQIGFRRREHTMLLPLKGRSSGVRSAPNARLGTDATVTAHLLTTWAKHLGFMPQSK